MPPFTGIAIAHAPELVAKGEFFEQFVYAQFEYEPVSGAPTSKIAIQSLARGLGSPEKETVDVPPLPTLDGLALTGKMGVSVSVGVGVGVGVGVNVGGPPTVTTFDVPLFVSELAEKIRNS